MRERALDAVALGAHDHADVSVSFIKSELQGLI